MITAVLHRPPAPPTEGASSRLTALLEHLRARDPEFRQLLVDAERQPSGRRALRFLRWAPRLAGLAARCLLGPNRVVLLSAPALPFFDTPSRLDLLCASAFLALLRAGKRWTGTTVVLNLHDLRSLQLRDFGVDVPEAALEIFRKLERRSFRASDFVLSPVGGWPDYLVQNHGLDPAQLVEFPNGCVRPEESGEAPPGLPGGVRFVYAGTLTPPGRGLEEMVRRFRQVRRRDVSLLLLGPGGDWCREAAGGDPRIRYLGAKPVRECMAVLRACDVALYPYPDLFYFSITHATNKVALYLVCGLPILAVRSRAIARFLEQEEAGLACDVERLAEEMERVAAEPELRQRWRRNVERLAPSYYWDVIIDRALRVIGERSGLQMPGVRQ